MYNQVHQGRGGAWGAWLGVVEITNIPLSGITALPMVGGKGGTLHVSAAMRLQKTIRLGHPHDEMILHFM
jgi:hypothetical protein